MHVKISNKYKHQSLVQLILNMGTHIIVLIYSLQNKCRTADPDRQNSGRSGKLSFFVIYEFWQNCASVRQVSDLIYNFEDWIQLFLLSLSGGTVVCLCYWGQSFIRHECQQCLSHKSGAPTACAGWSADPNQCFSGHQISSSSGSGRSSIGE